MFVIEARKQGKLWISGIFLKEQDKDTFMQEMPARLRRIHNVVELPRRRYPLYIIEIFGKSFEYATKSALLARIRHIRRTETDEAHFMYYVVTEEFSPDRPGTDSMGCLDHEHVDNRFLKRFARAKRL